LDIQREGEVSSIGINPSLLDIGEGVICVDITAQFEVDIKITLRSAVAAGAW